MTIHPIVDEIFHRILDQSDGTTDRPPHHHNAKKLCCQHGYKWIWRSSLLLDACDYQSRNLLTMDSSDGKVKQLIPFKESFHPFFIT